MLSRCPFPLALCVHVCVWGAGLGRLPWLCVGGYQARLSEPSVCSLSGALARPPQEAEDLRTDKRKVSWGLAVYKHKPA